MNLWKFIAAITLVFIAVPSPAAACLAQDLGGTLNVPLCEAYASRPAKPGTASARKPKPKAAERVYRSHLVPQQMVSFGTRYNAGPKPKRWCGWWMRTQYGGGPEYNVAWNWRKRGVASGPHVGAVVVWRHHVGVIVGRASNGQWLVKSGNDGNAVRVRARSVKGAIFRAYV